MKWALVGIFQSLFVVSAVAATYTVNLTESEWKCSQESLAYLAKQGVLTLSCHKANGKSHTCKVGLGKKVTGGLFSAPRYESLTDLDGNTRIKFYAYDGLWEQQVAGEMHKLIHCKDCLEELEEDCFCADKKIPVFLTDDGTFEIAFCMQAGTHSQQGPVCTQKACGKMVSVQPDFGFFTWGAEIRLKKTSLLCQER